MFVMRRLIAVTSTALLTFFAVALGLRFAESSMKAFLTAQVSQGQFTSWPLETNALLNDLVPGADGSMWIANVVGDSWSSTKGSFSVTRISKDGTMKNFPLYSNCDGAVDDRYRIVGFADKIWFTTCLVGVGAIPELASIDFDGKITKYGNAPGATENQALLLNTATDRTMWAFSGPSPKCKINASGP